MRRPADILPLALLAAGALASCAAPAPRPPPDHDTIKQRATIEVERICALPEPKRQAEIARVRKETGLELQCANAPASSAP